MAADDLSLLEHLWFGLAGTQAVADMAVGRCRFADSRHSVPSLPMAALLVLVHATGGVETLGGEDPTSPASHLRRKLAAQLGQSPQHRVIVKRMRRARDGSLFDRADFDRLCQFVDPVRVDPNALWCQSDVLDHEVQELDLGRVVASAARVGTRRERRASALALPLSKSPSDLLGASNGVVPFMGRARQLGSLHRWLLSEAAVPVAAIVGEAGAGKSRLAFRFGDDAESRGWRVVYIPLEVVHDRQAEFLLEKHDGHDAPPTLCVVDYAEARVPFVEKLVSLVAAERGRGRTRVLLVARERGPGRWLESFPALSALEQPSAITLIDLDRQPLTEAATRALYDASLRAFVDALGSADERHKPGREARRSHLAEPFYEVDLWRTRGVPLAIAVEALLQVLGDASVGDPIERALEHQRQYWRFTAPNGAGEGIIETLVGVAALTGVRSTDRLIALMSPLDGWNAIRASSTKLALAEWCLNLATAGRDGQPGDVLQPDLLVEALVARLLTASPSLLRQVISQANSLERARLGAVLIRLTGARPMPRPSALTLGEVGSEGLALLKALGETADSAGRLAEALQFCSACYQRHLADNGAIHPDSLRAMNDVAMILSEMGRRQEALALFEECARLRRRLPETQRDEDAERDLIVVMNNIAHVAVELGRFDDARDGFDACLARFEQMATRFDRAIQTVEQNRAEVDLRAGRYADALARTTECRKQRVRLFGSRDEDALRSLKELAAAHAAFGRFGEALNLIRRCQAGYRKALREHHPLVLSTSYDRAVYEAAAGDTETAMDEATECCVLRERHLADAHVEIYRTRSLVARLRSDQGHHGAAIKALRQCLRGLRRVVGVDDPATLAVMHDLGCVLLSSGQVDEASRVLDASVKLRVRTLGAAHPSTLASTMAAARACVGREPSGELPPGRAFNLYRTVLDGRLDRLRMLYDSRLELGTLVAHAVAGSDRPARDLECHAYVGEVDSYATVAAAHALNSLLPSTNGADRGGISGSVRLVVSAAWDNGSDFADRSDATSPKAVEGDAA